MRTTIIVLAAALLGGPAIAQGNSILVGDKGFANSAGPSGGLEYWRDETPSLRQQKLDRALRLREEARLLAAQDGGDLSEKNRRYLKRKADNILYGRRTETRVRLVTSRR